MNLAHNPPEVGIRSKHPVLLSALLGSLGGLVGTLVCAALLLIFGLLFADAVIGAPDPVDNAEGVGYLIGLYCLVMFPIGSMLVGGIPGAITGASRVSRDLPLTARPPLLAGFLGVVFFTFALVAILASLSLDSIL